MPVNQLDKLSALSTTIVAKWNQPNNSNCNCENKKSWGEMKKYEYLKENTRYSVLFGMDSTLNLTMCSA